MEECAIMLVVVQIYIIYTDFLLKERGRNLILISYLTFSIIYQGTCNDGILNQGETQIDCGGVCERLCGNNHIL